jgi:hypothetical protein
MFIRWKAENVRGSEKAGRFSFFNKVDCLQMNRAQFNGKSCFATGASKRPTGVNAPVVIFKKCPALSASY